MLGPPLLRALEPCIDDTVRGLHLSITTPCRVTNDGLRSGQLHRRAELQPRQMKSSSLCVSHTPLLAALERNGSLQTKTNKLAIWIWTLHFNHLVPYTGGGGGLLHSLHQVTYSNVRRADNTKCWTVAVVDRRAKAWFDLLSFVLIEVQTVKSGRYVYSNKLDKCEIAKSLFVMNKWPSALKLIK